MNCTNCGAEIKDGLKFCTNCGANLSQQMVQSEPEQLQTPTASMDVPATPEGAVPLQKRNTQRTIAIACGLLILLVIVFVGGLFLWKTLTPKELLLDADTIKDGTLLNTLTVKYDKDGDGKLSEEELGEVQDLELDSGNDYSYLYLFRNLTSVNVKNSDVTSLDFSKNENLKKADFRDAPNIIDINLPDMPSYDDVKLPDNDDVNVTFPDNSEYEVKYVPKKVEETTITSYGSRSDTSTTTYTQDVQSATKINSLTIQSQESSEKKLTYSYDDSGRINAWGITASGGHSKDIAYDENNQVSSEAAKINSDRYSTQNASYAENGDVSYFSYPTSNSNSVTKIVNENGVISYESSYYWKLDGDKLTESVIPNGGGAGYYTKWNYSWDGNRVSSLVLALLDNINTPQVNITGIESYASVKVGESETISFEYDGNNMTKASYSSGFTQNFTYDSHGNIIAMTSTGTPSPQYMTFTTNCKVEYAQVIGKKNAQALNFLVLPGINNKGLFHHTLSIRGITLAGVVTSYTSFTQDFSGKFWWDEENIINNQVEATNAKNSDLMEDDLSSSNSDDTEKLNAEAKEAYKTKIAEYAQYQGAKNVQMSGGTWFTGVNLLLLNLSRSNFYYSLYDLNGDGVNELLISADGGSGSFIADSFAYSNGELKRVCASGEKWDFSVSKGAYINLAERLGYDSWTVSLFKFEGPFDFTYDNGQYIGARLTRIREYGIEEYSRNGSAYYIAEDGVRHDCSMEEMTTVTASWKKYEDESIAWTPITQQII